MKAEDPQLVNSHDIRLDAEYFQWLSDIIGRYRSAQIKAAVRVNAEKLRFNWYLGRDLVSFKAESRWGDGIVEKLSLDLQQAFPMEKGFGERNLQMMKQWYLFYTDETNSLNSKQLVSELQAASVQWFENPKQPVSDLTDDDFPEDFALIPWGHHIAIVQHSETLDEALFYLRYTIENSLSREVLTRIMKKDDLYHHQPALNGQQVR